MSIKVTSLSKFYSTQKALDNLSFEIKSGEIIGLLGPNGAGKSTLMKCMMGLIQPNEGEILITDLKVDAIKNKTNSLIGYLPEHNPMYNQMYPKEFLCLCCDVRKIPHQKAEETINAVGLSAVLNKKISELSKGYKQRVGIAQAIIHNPEILIFDEPTNGLDPNQIIEIRELILETAKNKTVIISTHIMQEVEAMCSKVILLHQGKMITYQSVSELMQEYDSLENAFKKLTS
jgi:ABC-2 type transport system ATP-binding protein